MTTPPPDTSPAPRRWTALDPRQRRVLGVLVEKAKTTPAGYPMTASAIVTGCNQKSNRDPLMALDEIDVGNALVELRDLKVVSELDWLGRVPKYKHHAYEWLGVGKAEIAVMTELLLRGAQQLGELRARAARMEPIADLAALKPIVDGLIARGLMIALTPPGRGQIVSHNLYPPPELAEVRSQYGRPGGRVSHDPDEPGARHSGPLSMTGQAPSPPPAPSVTPAVNLDRVARLESDIAELRTEIVHLRARVSELEAGAGPAPAPPAGRPPTESPGP